MRHHPVLAALALVAVGGAVASCGGDSDSAATSTAAVSVPPSSAAVTTSSLAPSTAAPTANSAVTSSSVAATSSTSPATSTTAATTSTTATTTTTTAAPTSSAAGSAGGDDGVPTPSGPKADSTFCQAAFRAEQASRELDTLSSSAETDQSQIAAGYADLKVAANRAFDSAPADLERATSIMKSVFNQVDGLMAEHGYDRQATFNDPRYEDLIHQSEQPEVVAANEDYQQYLDEQCGIG